MTAMPRLPNPLTPERLQGLMRERPYWDTSHPRFKIYHRLVQRGFEILYPGPVRYGARGTIDSQPLKPEHVTHLVAEANREMGEIERDIDGAGGTVHVRAHMRVVDGKQVEVSAYERTAPVGSDAGSRVTTESPKAQNFLDGAEDVGNEPDIRDAQAGTDDDRPKSVSPVPNPEMRNDPEGLGHFGASRIEGPHKGIDILAKPGDEVVSPVDGKIDRITAAYPDPKFKGLETVVIKGDDGWEYKFLYVTPKDSDGQIIVQEKDRVSAGDPIGTA